MAVRAAQQQANGVVPGTPEEQAEHQALTSLVILGRPRRYIERYFKISTEPGPGQPPIVPMLLSNEPNQEYYYERLFSPAVWEREHPGLSFRPWNIDALCLKDRKARWSSFVAAVLTAKMFCVPGTHILCVVNAEDTFPVIHSFIDGFYRNMPDWARPDVMGNQWGVESKTIVWEGGKLKSSFTIRTAATANVGTGVTPTDVWLDEYPKFPMTFSKEAMSSLRASMPPGSSLWRGGTVGPNGADCIAYGEIQDFKRGLSQIDYLFRTWFQNPANHLKPESRGRRPQDRYDDSVKPGVQAGPDGEKEPVLARQFPDDGMPVEWRLAWRRAKLRDALQDAGGDEDVAKVLFQREHPENDEAPWLVPGHIQFKQSLMEMQTAIAAAPENALIVSEPLQGLLWRCWRPYDPSHVYAGLMDLGSGGGGDDSTMQLYDCTSALYMGELHGNVTDPYNAVTAAVKALRAYGSGPFALETNRFPGIGNYVKKDLGYENVVKPPRRPNETQEAYHKRPYGINVSAVHHSDREPSAEEMLAEFKGDFNAGAYRVVNPSLLKTMQTWDPSRDKHTPDRIAGARLRRHVIEMAKAISPVTGAIGADRTRASLRALGHGRRPAMPFARAR